MFNTECSIVNGGGSTGFFLRAFAVKNDRMRHTVTTRGILILSLRKTGLPETATDTVTSVPGVPGGSGRQSRPLKKL